MHNSSPYGSLDGLAFKEKGTDEDRDFNIQRSLEVLREYILSGGHQSDVRVAIEHIEWSSPEVKYLTAQLKNYLFLDEEVADRYSKCMCVKLYNLIGDRIAKQ